MRMDNLLGVWMAVCAYTVLSSAAAAAPLDIRGSDTVWYVKGHITVTPLQPGIVDAKAERLKWAAECPSPSMTVD